jgi:hypothetical protein
LGKTQLTNLAVKPLCVKLNLVGSKAKANYPVYATQVRHDLYFAIGEKGVQEGGYCSFLSLSNLQKQKTAGSQLATYLAA